MRRSLAVEVRAWGVITPAARTAGELLALVSALEPQAAPLCLVPHDCLEEAARLPTREMRKVDRFSLLALAAARRALVAGGVETEELTCGVVTGNMFAGWTFTEPQLRALHTAGLENVSPYLATAWFPAAPQGQITIHLGLRGFAKTITTDRCAGAQAIGMAFERIRSGRSNLLLAGGVEAPVTPLVERALSARGESSSLCEGAAYLLLSPSHRKCGVQIHAHRTQAVTPTRSGLNLLRAELASFVGPDPDPIQWLFLNAPSEEELSSERVAAALGGIQPLTRARCVLLTPRIGESLAASGALAAAAASEALARSPSGTSAIIASWGHQCYDLLWLKREIAEMETSS